MLVRHRDRHPDAIVEPTDTYFERSLAEILASFPLNRITRRFYDAMIGVLPPQYIRGAAGFFLSEAANQSIHAQFIKHGGRTYGGYADLAPGTRNILAIAKHAALESTPDAPTPPPGGYPAD